MNTDLVDFVSIETVLKFIQEGIDYEGLTEEEKLEYEKTFTDEDGNLPDHLDSTALNKWIFNEDTIRQVLHTVMTNGLKIDYGNKIGKTIM